MTPVSTEGSTGHHAAAAASSALASVESMQARLEWCLSGIPYFSGLRSEEKVAVARLFEFDTLTAGESRAVARTDPPRLGVVLSGTVRVALSVPGSSRNLVMPLSAGDTWNDLGLLTGQPSEGDVRALKDAQVAYLTPSSLETLLGEHPSCAPAIARRVAAELKWKNDFLRSLQTFSPSDLDRWPFSFILARRRAALRNRVASVLHPTVRAVYERVVRDPGREPMFWVLIGFILSLVVSRAVVTLILSFGLQDQLFNLRPSDAGNPVHIHHFNYGFIVAFTSGLLAFIPYCRRVLRTLSFLVGFGLGLIFDEFGLIVNLSPDYYQADSYYAMAILGALLILITYFRGLLGYVLRRASALVRGTW